MIGPGIKPLGEIKSENQLYQKQLAATISGLIGQHFEANHPVAEGIALPVNTSDAKEGMAKTAIQNNGLMPNMNIRNVLLIAIVLLLLHLVKTKKPAALNQ
jgi:hypothetical protein